MTLLDALAYSSLWVALAAAALVTAASLALGASPQPSLVGLVACGTLVVYGVDRLRDESCDAAVAPRLGARRSLFAARGAAILGLCVAVAAPSAVRNLGWVPLATFVALGPFRADERYGLLVVDGALLAGGAAAAAALV